MAVVTSKMTLEEFLRLPEEEPALEFADGEVTKKVSPKGRHSTLSLELGASLLAAARANGNVRVFSDLRATFGHASRVPDIAIYRTERVPTTESDDVADDFDIPPDVAIEIASPEQSTTYLVRKCTWFVENGVIVALMVDPDDRSALAFRKERNIDVWRGADLIDLGEILPEFKLSVDELFATLKVRRQP